MPMFDRVCNSCGLIKEDCLEPSTYENPACTCGGVLERTWLPGRASSVIGDECDVMIKHGLCNADGSPRRYTSKQEIRREEIKRGLTNYVVHQGTKGGDRSKHTTRWY